MGHAEPAAVGFAAMGCRCRFPAGSPLSKSTIPAVFAALSQTVLIPRMSLFAARIQRAIEHGELRDDIDLRLFIEILAGPIFFHTLVSDRFMPHTPDYAERLIDTILAGLAPR